MIGSALLHYRIVEKLGEGGMGVVYKARDTHLDRAVAVKVLRPDKIVDRERRARFVQEARAASALNHPNIIHVYDVSCDGGTDFIAMEYVEGRTLDGVIPTKGMRAGQALKIAAQIADALARAHAAGIIHRDLKPANIMVDDRGIVKVLDFGLAKLRESGRTDTPDSTATVASGAVSLTENGAIVGTVAYMSPEQAEGKPLDPRSDIFSFGSLLYEMLTGQKAFRGDSNISTLSAVLHQEPEELSAVSRDLEKLVARCLRKAPDRRWQTMADLHVALLELIEESDSQPKAVPTPGARAPGLRMAVGMLAALPLLAGAVWLISRYILTQAPPPALAQLTSEPGFESSPCFSPDGKQVVFSWSGERDNNRDIYVKQIGETDARRLTTDPASDDSPAWSPDGRWIAFTRKEAAGSCLWLVSAVGGTERKLADVPTIGQLSWSPDGKWLAVARGISVNDVGNTRGIFLLPLGGGDPRRISAPRAPAFDLDPGFSPDGRQLAYASCTSRWSCDLYVQQIESNSAPAGVPRRITRQGIWIYGLSWSRDGQSLVYSGSISWAMTPRLWRVATNGDRPPERLDLAGFLAVSPAVAPAGDLLAFSHRTGNSDVWRLRIGGSAEPLLSSSLEDYSPQFSPDGTRIAFASGRSGDRIEVWTADADGAHPVQLTSGPGHGQGSPRWSPDGRLVAFDSLGQDGTSSIYLIDAKGGPARALTSGPFSDFMPSWSRDGRWLYFFSNRSGRDEVWRVHADGSEPQKISANGGVAPQESTDGKTLFYGKGFESPLFSRRLDGGGEAQVVDFVKGWSFAVVGNGIYYLGRLDAARLQPIQFHDFSSRGNRLVTRVGPYEVPGLSVSPDGKTILYIQLVTPGADLMLIQNFR